MVLQINNLQALERLIGGDTQIEFDIRQNIVDAFVKKHLKQVATEAVVRNATYAVTSQLNETYFRKMIYSPILSEQGKEVFQEQFTKSIYETVSKVFNESEIIKAANDAINKAATHIVDQLTDEIMEKRINALVDQKIKERLGL